MATPKSVPRTRNLLWRLWTAAVVFPALAIGLPVYVIWAWLVPGLVESMGPGGEASGSWVAWALLGIGIVASGTSFIVALTTSWRIIRLAWRYSRRDGRETRPEPEVEVEVAAG